MREFLKDVWMHGGEESRAITPENITGEKGRAAMSASHLGVGRKGSCCARGHRGTRHHPPHLDDRPRQDRRRQLRHA